MGNRLRLQNLRRAGLRLWLPWLPEQHGDAALRGAKPDGDGHDRGHDAALRNGDGWLWRNACLRRLPQRYAPQAPSAQELVRGVQPPPRRGLLLRRLWVRPSPQAQERLRLRRRRARRRPPAAIAGGVAAEGT